MGITQKVKENQQYIYGLEVPSSYWASGVGKGGVLSDYYGELESRLKVDLKEFRKNIKPRVPKGIRVEPRGDKDYFVVNAPFTSGS